MLMEELKKRNRLDKEKQEKKHGKQNKNFMNVLIVNINGIQDILINRSL